MAIAAWLGIMCSTLLREPGTYCGTRISHGAALVANATWDGPVAADGTRLWYGLEKGTFLAGTAGNAAGIASTQCSSNGTCVGMMGNAGEGWLAYGAVKDPSFDSSNLTLDAYSWLMHDSETEWKSLWSTNEPDLSALEDRLAAVRQGARNALRRLLDWAEDEAS